MNEAEMRRLLVGIRVCRWIDEVLPVDSELEAHVDRLINERVQGVQNKRPLRRKATP